MKRKFALVLSMILCLSLTACGGDKKEAVESAKTQEETAETPEESTKEFSAAQQAAAQRFTDMTTRYDEVVEKVNADPNLADMQEIVAVMNELSDAIIETDDMFADPENLTTEDIESLDLAINQTYAFLDEVEAMLANYSGKQVITIPVEIVNNTGADLSTLSMSPQNDENWGVNLLEEPLLHEESGITEMTFTEDTLVWDLNVGDASGNTLTFMGIDFTEAPLEGAKLVLSVEGDSYVASFLE